MRPERLLAVTKAERPDLDVLVCRSCGEERAVAGKVHGDDGQLVTKQREEQLQRVGIKHLSHNKGSSSGFGKGPRGGVVEVMKARKRQAAEGERACVCPPDKHNRLR